MTEVKIVGFKEGVWREREPWVLTKERKKKVCWGTENTSHCDPHICVDTRVHTHAKLHEAAA